MKRTLAKALGILLVVGGLVAVLWPVENWRMYDANWRPLAMTQAEGYCAGILLGQSGFTNVEDKEGMAECMAANEKSNEPSIGAVIPAFCDGLWMTAGFSPEECRSVTEGYNIWPLMNGGYTWEWNDSNQRPQVVQSNISQAPRREGRDDGSRTDAGRGFGE